MRYGLRTAQALHFERVVFAEIDGFGDVGIGFRPGLAGFIDQPGVELQFAAADGLRGSAEHRDAVRRIGPAPFREEGVRVLDRFGRHGRCRFLVDSYDFRRIRWIDRLQLVTTLQPLAGDQQIVLAPELGAHLPESRFHRLPVGGYGKIGIRFVFEISHTLN